MSDHAEGSAEYRASRTGDASANVYANTGIHIGDFNNFNTARLIEFEHIGIPDRTEPQWAEFPHRPQVLKCEFTEPCDRLFSLKSLVYGADLFFDLVLLNRGDSPAVLSKVGVNLDSLQQVIYLYGIPQAAKLKPPTDKYVLPMPDLHENYDVDLMDHMSPDAVDIRVEHTLDDPVYLPAQAPYRYVLHLKDYQQNIPNHAQMRLTADVGNQTVFSPKLHIFTR